MHAWTNGPGSIDLQTFDTPPPLPPSGRHDPRAGYPARNGRSLTLSNRPLTLRLGLVAIDVDCLQVVVVIATPIRLGHNVIDLARDSNAIERLAVRALA